MGIDDIIREYSNVIVYSALGLVAWYTFNNGDIFGYDIPTLSVVALIAAVAYVYHKLLKDLLMFQSEKQRLEKDIKRVMEKLKEKQYISKRAADPEEVFSSDFSG